MVGFEWRLGHYRKAEKSGAITAEADWEQSTIRPSWPRVCDLDGDGVKEVLVADGNELGQTTDVGLASRLQVLDGKTGSPRWKEDQRGRLRSIQRQFNHFLVGPDQDQDGVREIYAFSLFRRDERLTDLTHQVLYKSPSSHVTGPKAMDAVNFYVDAFSGATGKRLWHRSHRLSFADPDSLIVNVRPWEQGSQPAETGIIQISTPSEYAPHDHLVIVSCQSGDILRVAQDVRLQALADFDRNGSPDVLGTQKGDTNRNQRLVALSGDRFNDWKKIDNDLMPIGDMNNDGVADFVGKYMGPRKARYSRSLDWMVPACGNEITLVKGSFPPRPKISMVMTSKT